jgi:hypothetical protein
MVEPQILSFQARYAALLHHRRLRAVRPAQIPEQERMLSDIWDNARLGETANGGDAKWPPTHSGQRSWDGWARIGLSVDEGEERPVFLNEVDLFRDVGELGLECLVSNLGWECA